MNINNDSFSNSINIAGLILGLMNLEENLTQGDKQDLIDKFNQEANHLLSETHQHLESQDNKMDLILKKINIQEELLKEILKKIKITEIILFYYKYNLISKTLPTGRRRKALLKP